MIARVITQQLKAQFRDKMYQCMQVPLLSFFPPSLGARFPIGNFSDTRQAKSFSEDLFRKVVLEHLNLVLGQSPDSNAFWRRDLKAALMAHFKRALSPEEQVPLLGLRAKYGSRVYLI